MDKILIKIKKLIPKKVFKALQPFYHFLMSWFSAFIYCYPGNELIVIGVTGTTGKTTSIGLIAKMLEEAGFKVGYTSTAMFNDGEKEWLNDKKMTMIGRFFTQRILRRMVKNNCQYAIIETTSEGVAQFRHKFINYDVVLITGLYPEHIDSHGSFENYKKAKGRLFAHLKKCSHKYIDEKNKVIKTLSGIDTVPFKRYCSRIPLNELIDLLNQAKIDGEHLGYDDLDVYINEDLGIIDIDLFGMTDFTESDIKMMDRFDVINRKKEKTIDGQSRDDLFKKKLNGTLHKTENGWVVRYSDLHQYGYGYHMFDTLLSPDDQEDFMGTVGQMIKWDGMNVDFKFTDVKYDKKKKLIGYYAKILK